LFTHPGKLSDPAFDRLKASIAENEGADNAGSTLILEEGMKWETPEVSARDSQLMELTRFGVEQVARITGAPRPLLMMDDTSWGTGLQALVQFFHQFGLSPWFSSWEQAGERSLLVGEEKDRFEIKFNSGAFLRGSPKEQAEYFNKALGSGGSPGWLSQNEVRELDDRPPSPDGDGINKGSGSKTPEQSNGGAGVQP
jgi:HK97 family phage portal protein